MPSIKKSATSKTKKKIAKKQVKKKVKEKTGKKLVTDTEVVKRVRQARKRTRKSIQEKKDGKFKISLKMKQEHNEEIQRTLQETKQRIDPELEGDLKDLPEWLPKALVRECDSIKHALLDEGYTIKEIIGFTVARQREFPTVPTWGPNVSIVPKEFQYPIDRLNYIVALIKIGEKRGIQAAQDAYLGEGPHELLREASKKQRQREVASRPRTDAIQKLIDEIVREEPQISAKEVLHTLKQQEGDGVIYEIDDDRKKVIEWNKDDGSLGNSLTFSALQSRVTRARKK